MGGSAPSPPSPTQGLETARQLSGEQFGYNQLAQTGSQYNQSNPFGSLQYVIGPDGRPTALSNFSPEQMPLWAQTLMSKGIAGGEGASLLGGANYGFGGQPKDVIGNTANGITGDIVNGQLSYLKPYQEWETNNLDTKLKNQGLEPGNPAYDMAMKRMQDNHNLAAGDIIGKAAPQAYSTASQLYTMPAQMAMALGNYGGPANPSSMYGATPALQPPNLQGAFSSSMDALNQQYQAQLAKYQADQNAMWSIPSAVLGGWASTGFAGAPAMMAML